MSTIQEFEAAAAKATQASSQAYTWAKGPINTSVQTDSGLVPTIAEFTRANQVMADNAINALGWVLAGDFSAGCTVTGRNQYVLEVGGSTYRWDGPLPKTVPPSSSPSPEAAGSWVRILFTLDTPPLPDVWAPLSDSLRMITGYGRDVLVGSDVVARMVNFSRNSTATYIGKDGQLKTATANEPRFEKEGLLLEGQSTNLIPTSSTLTTQTLLVQAGTHTLSFYGTGTVSLSGAATGAISGTGANNRVALTFVAAAGNLTLTVTGACTNGQLEALSCASSYIPTNGSAATRATDVCWIPVENGGLPGMDNEKTMSLTSNILGVNGPFNFILATPWGAIDYTFTHERVSGSMLALEMNTPVALKTSVRKVARFTKGGGCAAIFGDIQKTGPTADWSLSTSRIVIGSLNESGANPHFGHVKDLKIWLKPLSDAQMKAIA